MATYDVSHPRWDGLDRLSAVEQALANGNGGSGSSTLSQVLANGNDAGGQNIVNVGDISLAGLTGATAAARFVGGTATGAPVSGTFAKGDFVIDQTGKVWICTAAGSPGTWANASGATGGIGVYGDGSDGAAAFDGTTTVTGSSKSGSTYTLTRDVYYSSVTISSGVTVVTGGFRLFCSGTVTGADSTSLIQHNAGASVFGLTNGSSSLNTAGGSANGLSTSGGTATTGVGVAGSNAGNVFSIGGVGGAGGTGTSGAGGAGGTLVAAAMPPIRSAPFAVALFSFVAARPPQGGTGGGSGAGDGTNNGGNGGAGGGIVPVYAKTFTGTGAIQARGYQGASPSVGNVGGGGGGGGGAVIVVSGSVSGGAISGWTIDANGGAAGSPHGTGTNNAAAGASGSVILIPN